jgi:hypothetical protein
MVGSTYSATEEDAMRKLIISLAATAAITAATAAPAFATPPDPCQTPAHVVAITPGGGCNGTACHLT